MNVATDAQKALYDQLCKYVDTLGAPIVALYGAREDGTCRCQKGADCGKNAFKHPDPQYCPRGFKDATTDKKKILDWVRRGGATLNWGISTGKPLPGGGYLLVLDVDPRNSGDDTLELLEKEHGKVPNTPTQITGGGGLHYFLRVPTAMPSASAGAGLDLKGDGGYVVVSPSKHHSGRQYEWDAIRDLDMEIAEAPTWITLGKAAKPRPPWTGKKAKDSIIGAAFEAAGWLGIELTEGRHAVHCPWSNLHTDGRGKGQDASTAILPPTEDSSAGGFVCKHSHCTERTWKDAMAALPVDAAVAARRKFHTVIKADDGHRDLTPVVTGDLTPEQLQEMREHLYFSHKKDGTSVLKRDFVNILEILRHDPRWQGVLQFDNFSNQVLLTREPSWHKHDKREGYEGHYPRQWQDEDAARVKLWLARYWGVEWDVGDIERAAVVAAQGNGVHPVRTYLRSLEWDGVERVETWLHDYCGADDTDYSRNVGRWWLISAVARVMKPGCKADHVLILEGPQGIGKSTVFAVLGGEWTCDSTISIGEKDAYQLIKGRWIIELAELDALSRADSSRAKAFFTSPVDTYRPSYGRAIVTVPRQCVFAGTVNHSQFLKDETGSRRYWPVLCRLIRATQLRDDRDQIWAEALRLYNSGARWWPAGVDEQALCTEQQALREVSDEWEGVIDRWLDGPDARAEMSRYGHVTGAAILEHALKLDTGRWGAVEMSRVNRAMVRLGWQKARSERSWVFTRKK